MTFEEWWGIIGARKHCETHEGRARMAWDAAMKIFIDDLAHSDNHGQMSVNLTTPSVMLSNQVDKTTAKASLEVLYQQALIAGNVEDIEVAATIVYTFIDSQDDEPQGETDAPNRSDPDNASAERNQEGSSTDHSAPTLTGTTAASRDHIPGLGRSLGWPSPSTGSSTDDPIGP